MSQPLESVNLFVVNRKSFSKGTYCKDFRIALLAMGDKVKIMVLDTGDEFSMPNEFKPFLILPHDACRVFGINVPRTPDRNRVANDIVNFCAARNLATIKAVNYRRENACRIAREEAVEKAAREQRESLPFYTGVREIFPALGNYYNEVSNVIVAYVESEAVEFSQLSALASLVDSTKIAVSCFYNNDGPDQIRLEITLS